MMEPNEVHPDVREVIAELSENYIRGTCGHKVEIDRLRTALASRDAELAELRERCAELERAIETAIAVAELGAGKAGAVAILHAASTAAREG